MASSVARQYNVAKGKNPSYMISISCPSMGLEVIADLPEQTVLAAQSDWESRLPPGLDKIFGAIQGAGSVVGVSPQSQEWNTRQMWVNSSPIEFAVTLLLDAQTSGYKDVFLPAMSLFQLVHPESYGDILLPPGPSRLDKKKNAVNVNIGRMIRIEDCILVACQPTFDNRLDAEGYPIACDLEMTIRTSVVYSRNDAARMIQAPTG